MSKGVKVYMILKTFSALLFYENTVYKALKRSKCQNDITISNRAIS